jgi:copper chaperone CopZ
MTCVACSSAIERGLTHALKDKGLVYDTKKEKYDVNVALLMHKMTVTLQKDTAEKHKVNSQMIIEEVEDLGFEAGLLNIHEVSSLGAKSDEKSGNKKSIVKNSFLLTGMTCSACTGSIERHFKKSVDGVIDINVSLLTHKAVVEYDSSLLKPMQIISEIEDLGFEAEFEVSGGGETDIREVA